MVWSVSQPAHPESFGFSVFDQLSYSDPSLPFGSVLSANRVREPFVENDALFGYGDNDLWDTGLTLWAFIGQVLQDGKQRSCNAAVTRATRYRLEHRSSPPSPDSGEFCRARRKLQVPVLRRLVGEIADRMALSVPVHWRWHGRPVKLVDGFTFTLPDTPANQRAFPQLKTQKPGVGFPIARACAVLSLADACIHDVAIGPYAGKETGETALLRKVLNSFKPGDVLLADRYFCSFFMLALLKTHGVDVCMSLHQLRKIDPSKVTWLGDNDCLDTWHRPQRAKWMSPELYNTLPERLDIRIATFTVTRDNETEPLMVVTTLVDLQTYPATAIGQLYGYRWCVELDIFSIKQMLNLDHLRCKSPEMMAREVWVTLLAYNLVRWVCAQAAFVHEKLARQMSFTVACNTLLSQWLMPPEASIRKTLGQYQLLQIASHEVADRPGRIEPRVVKRRRRKYPLMTKPRSQYKTAKAPTPHTSEKVR